MQKLALTGTATNLQHQIQSINEALETINTSIQKDEKKKAKWCQDIGNCEGIYLVNFY